ncbi:MAG: aromatic ring-hydroxylating dioxygenase subunit alpha, partial [Planctomycetaceae bacterium]|nr:aromatic ring-hydroxylating dioxygenase subunit alpha [Planctomycetaceae bacterium]
MFVHQNQLEYLLPSEAYSSESQFQLERERIFLPSWHPVATRKDLPRSGDFLTCELFGHPVLVRNFEGTLHAFQNVCAHRHCLLTHAPQGHSDKLRCQYHGWEYDETGYTNRIPDARCFRPFDRENSHLKKYRLELLGDTAFVSLTDEGPSLREFLDPHFEHLAERFSSPAWKPIYAWEYDCPSNWKVPAENTLESYHIPHLHEKSFGGIYPSEEESTHELTPDYTVLTYNSGEDPRVENWQSRFTRWLGGEVTNTYRHFHFHPHLILVTTDVFGY